MIPLLLLTFTAQSEPADPPPTVKLPPEVKAQPGRITTLKAETNGTVVRWAATSDDVDLIPFPDGKVALFCAAKPGKYIVLAWTAVGNEPSEAARCIVIVGDPNPKPPEVLAGELRKLFDADDSLEKAIHVQQLAVIYREAVGFIEKPEVRTAGQLADKLRASASLLLPADALVPIRKRLAEELVKQLPTDPEQPLDTATRKAAAELFDRIATSLEGLK